MKQEVIKLTQKQLVRLDIINKAISGFVTVDEAAQALGLSHRQIQRLKKEVKEYGAAALVHKNSLKPPHNALSPETRAKIVTLKKSKAYSDCNFAHFCDLLDEYHDIKISYSTLHKIMCEEGISSPKKRRRYKPHRRRKRRKQAGLLLQVDGTPFAWFKNDRKRYTIHGGIDDATGQVTSLYMCKNECLQGYFQMFRQTIENFGIPVSVYADRHTIFRSPNKDKSMIDTEIKAQDTQLGMAFRDLSIELIAARSPQAKGRIERLWGTLQSRLPVEFALRDITDIDEANEFLKEYVYIFNSQFAVEPEETESAFMQLPPHMDLDYIFCIREKRVIDAGGVFSYMNKTFKVEDGSYAGKLPAKTKITVMLNPGLGELGLKVKYKDLLFDVTRFIPPKRKPKTPKRTSAHPQSATHPWKYGQSLYSSYDRTLSDAEVMEMLEDAFLK
jgi:transposase